MLPARVSAPRIRPGGVLVLGQPPLEGSGAEAWDVRRGLWIGKRHRERLAPQPEFCGGIHTDIAPGAARRPQQPLLPLSDVGDTAFEDVWLRACRIGQ